MSVTVTVVRIPRWHRHRWARRVVTWSTWPLHHGTTEIRCAVCGNRKRPRRTR